MKKVVLLLPDEVLHIIGNPRGGQRVVEEITVDNIVDMLCLDDYHECYKIQRDQISVVSVENVSSDEVMSK